MKVKACQTLIKPREIEVPSFTDHSKTYFVTTPTIWNDAVCDCPSFEFAKKARKLVDKDPITCKHIRWLSAFSCSWAEPLNDDNSHLDKCPKCGYPAATFETDPEFT